MQRPGNMGIAAMVINSNTNIHTSDGRLKSQSDTRPVDSSKTAVKESGSEPQTSTTSDVSLSSQAQSLSRLESQLSSTPEVNSDRVSELKKAIAEGSYQINPESIAQRMLEQDEFFN